MYKAGKRPKSKRWRALKWVLLTVVLLACIGWAGQAIRHALKPKTVITQGRAVTTHVSYTTKTKHYNEGDFALDIPDTWQPIPRPAGPYKSFTWQSSDRITDGQVIEIYEDTIPENFSVNRVLIVEGENDHLMINGSISDNCSNYTDQFSSANPLAAPAKWQGVAFLCDQANQERDVIGTSSTDGINTVILKSQSAGASHKFLFTYTDYSVNPDYTVFLNVLNSLRMN
ncbi:MAG TPA: hypothetical protein VN778_01655 [Verrucomicrobiae bacterium]|nr:hypothetical protein [Verrucomicrobiae bacterium]